MNYWLFSMSSRDYAGNRALGFAAQGFEPRQRRKVERMEPRDRLMYYLRDRRLFAGVVTIAGRASREPQEAGMAGEGGLPAHVVRTRAEIVLPEGLELVAAEIAPRLEYLRRWPPESWPLALLEELHLLPRRDFDLLEGEMRRVLRGGGRQRAAPVPSRGAWDGGVGVAHLERHEGLAHATPPGLHGAGAPGVGQAVGS